MQDYDIKLAPGEVRLINVQADYIYYRAGSAGGADAAIEFAPRSGGESVFLYPGQSYRVPVGARMGADWTLRNRKGEATIIGQILMGEGSFQDNRISGAVEVIDGGKNRTMAGAAFLGGTAAIGSATQYTHLQLASVAVGRRVVIKTIMIFTNATQQVNVTTNPGLLGTLEGYARSKKVGGAASTAQMRSALTAGLTGSAPFYTFPTVTGGVPFLLTLQEPMVLENGENLLVEAASVGTYLGATFEFIEEVI